MNRKLSPFWTLFILTGLNLFNYFDRLVLSAVLPFIQSADRGLGLTDSQAGWLSAALSCRWPKPSGARRQVRSSAQAASPEPGLQTRGPHPDLRRPRTSIGKANLRACPASHRNTYAVKALAS